MRSRNPSVRTPGCLGVQGHEQRVATPGTVAKIIHASVVVGVGHTGETLPVPRFGNGRLRHVGNFDGLPVILPEGNVVSAALSGDGGVPTPLSCAMRCDSVPASRGAQMTAGPTNRMTTETAGDDGSVIYVVDDDKGVRQALDLLLRSVGLRVETFESPDEFLRSARSTGSSCLILDVRLRGKSGMAFHQEIVNSGMRIPVVFMTGHGDIEMGVKAMKAGALDFLAKPFKDQDMLDAVAQAWRETASGSRQRPR